MILEETSHKDQNIITHRSPYFDKTLFKNTAVAEIPSQTVTKQLMPQICIPYL